MLNQETTKGSCFCKFNNPKLKILPSFDPSDFMVSEGEKHKLSGFQQLHYCVKSEVYSHSYLKSGRSSKLEVSSIIA